MVALHRSEYNSRSDVLRREIRMFRIGDTHPQHGPPPLSDMAARRVRRLAIQLLLVVSIKRPEQSPGTTVAQSHAVVRRAGRRCGRSARVYDKWHRCLYPCNAC